MDTYQKTHADSMIEPMTGIALTRINNMDMVRSATTKVVVKVC